MASSISVKGLISGTMIGAKSRIKKRVLLKNVMHDAGFPTFQKKNFTMF